MFNALFDLGRVWVEASGQHLRGLSHQIHILNLSPCLHYFNNCRFNSIPPVIINFTLHLALLFCLFRLRHQNLDLVFVQVTFIFVVDLEFIFHRKWVGYWVLHTKFALDQGNKVHLDLLHRELSQRKQFLVCDCFSLVEQSQHNHLIGRAAELIMLTTFKSAAQLSWSQIQLPVELSAIVELREIELREACHSAWDFSWQMHLLSVSLFLLLGPVSCSEYLHIQFQFERVVDRTLAELYH